MKFLLSIAAPLFFGLLLQQPAQSPQDKRGLGIQASPTPTPVTQISPVHNPNKPDLVMQNGHADYVKDVEFSPDGKLVISASSDRTIKVWEVSSGRVVWTLLGHKLPVTAIAISPNGHWLASTEKYGPIRIWDLRTGGAVRAFAEKRGAIIDIAFSADGLLHSIGADVDYVWDIATGSDIRSINRRRKVEKFFRYKDKGVEKVADVSEHVLDFEAIAINEDGSRIAVRDKESRVLIRDSSGKQISKLSEPFTQKPEVMVTAFSTDGKLLALNHSIFGVVVWDTQTGSRVADTATTGQVIGLAFHPNNQLLTIGTFSGSAKKDKLTLVRLSPGDLPRTFEMDVRPSHLAFSKDGRLLALGGGESLGLWDVTQDNLLRAMRGGVQKVQAIAISPKGDLLATAAPVCSTMRSASAASQMSPLPSTGMSTWSTSSPMASQSASPE
jgi:WD40 repeat protein